MKCFDKGFACIHFDLVSDALELKVHETILEVNLGAMVANLNHYRAMLRPETKMVCMVKASAYGAGSYEIAKTFAGTSGMIIWPWLWLMKERNCAKQALPLPLSSWIRS